MRSRHGRDAFSPSPEMNLPSKRCNASRPADDWNVDNMNLSTELAEGKTRSEIPTPDEAAIRKHVEMIHTLAKGAGVDGILTFSRIDDKNNVNTERFAIGDVD